MKFYGVEIQFLFLKEHFPTNQTAAAIIPGCLHDGCEKRFCLSTRIR